MIPHVDIDVEPGARFAPPATSLRPAPSCGTGDAALADPTKATVQSALTGDAAAARELISVLTPVIHARVARCLMRRGAAAEGSRARELISDLVQEVFVELFREGGRALLAWDPERGMSLRNWVGLLAEQRVAAVLRGKRDRLVLAEHEPDSRDHDPTPERDDPEAQLSSRQALQALLDTLRADLSPQGFELFEALVLREEPIASVCSRTGLSTSAVQAWSSRLKRKAAQVLADLARSPQSEEPLQ